MKEKNKIQKTPATVRLRAYVPHLVIALISLLIFVLALNPLLDGSTKSVSEINRVNHSPSNEIVFAGAQNEGECFYYLKNYAAVGSTNKNALSDIFMTLPGTQYGENTISFSGTLEGQTCAVSANIAKKYGLNVGERARIIGTDKEFTVAEIINAQSGIDSDYLHEGIIVISYDEELLDRNYLYVSFTNDSDAYKSLERLIYVEDMKNGKGAELCLYLLIALFVLGGVMALCETLLFRQRREDYFILSEMGAPFGAMLLRVSLENLLKYTLPAIISLMIFGAVYGSYGVAYIIPALCFALACIGTGLAYSLIFTRRLYCIGAK